MDIHLNIVKEVEYNERDQEVISIVTSESKTIMVVLCNTFEDSIRTPVENVTKSSRGA